MPCKFHNNSNMNVTELNPLAKDLMGYMQKKIGFKRPPSAVTYAGDDANAKNILGKTAFYEPNSSSVTIYVTGRHPKDILRSLAHELVHHKQNEDGQFNDIGEVGEGYAQSNKKLRGMERQAYEMGNMCFRDWEDGYKNAVLESIYKQQQILRRNKTMKIHKWKNNELNRLLMERFLPKKKEYDLEEGQDRIFAPNHYCAHHVIHEGFEAYTVDHNWDAEKQQVTKYDIRFKDGTIKRNVHVSDLEILEAFNEGSHSGNRDKHPPVKDASKDKEDDDDKKVEEEKMPMHDHDDDPNTPEVPTFVSKEEDKAAKKKKGGKQPPQLAAYQAKKKKKINETLKRMMLDAVAKIQGENPSATAEEVTQLLRKQHPDVEVDVETVKMVMDDNASAALQESKQDRLFRKKVRIMLESFDFKKKRKKVTVRRRRK